MPTPVTVTIQVDATGAVQGSQQAATAISGALNNINASQQKVAASSQTANRFLEKFGDAPKRGIGILDALNSTIIQSTGGFQALGPASAAASTGLRAALFAISSFVGPVGTVVLGLSALAAIFAVTSEAAEKNAKAVEASGEAIRKLAQESGIVGASAQKVLQKTIVETELAMGQLRLQMAAVGGQIGKQFADQLGIGAVKADALKTRIAGISNADQKKSIEELVNEYAKLSERLDDLTGKTEKQKQAEDALKKSQEIRFSLLREGIAASQAQATTIAEHNAQILKNINLQIQQQSLSARQAKSIEEVNTALAATVSLIKQETAERIKMALTTTEQANVILEGQNKILEAEIQAAQQRKQITDEAKRNAQELQRRYQSIADTIASAFFTTHQTIGESFRALLRQMAQDLLASGLRDAIAQLAGVGKKGTSDITIAGVGVDLPLVRSTTGGRPSTSVTPTLTLPPSGGAATNINITVQALDTATLTAAVKERVIPIIENAAAGRRSRIALA